MNNDNEEDEEDEENEEIEIPRDGFWFMCGAEFLFSGLAIIEKKYRKKIPFNFRNHYGISFIAASYIFYFYIHRKQYRSFSNNSGYDFLVLLKWFKSYNTEITLSKELGISKNTLLGIRRSMCIHLIQHISEIDFESRDLSLNITGIVDCTVKKINRPSDMSQYNQWEFYCNYHSCHCIKYLTFVTTSPCSRFLYVSDGFKGKVSDNRCYRETLMKKLGENDIVIADKGFRKLDPDHIIHAITANNSKDRQYNNIIMSLQAPVEHLNGRITNFYIMKNTYRHKIEEHSCYFFLICNFINVCELFSQDAHHLLKYYDNL
eukprot:TRINITY_DN503_c0_g4_i3.p1 TRINITY_DN503_c0_g4~~TRINITY_DN503_c0_g4_i3.p1  ORF type:complete len:318 (-),score=38.16 TRINITY_DN503_c0_g4_i3:541-1494(-)